MSAVRDFAPTRSIGERLRSASEIAPDKLPRLLRIAEEWATSAQAALAALTSVPVTVAVLDVARIDTPSQDDELLAGAALAASLNSPKFERPGFVTLDTAVAETVICALFGGGAFAGTEREMTGLDKAMVDLALIQFTTSAEAAFAPLGPLAMTAGAFMSPDELAQAIGEVKEHFLAIRLEVQAAGGSTVLCFALPESFVQPHRRTLAAAPERSAPVADESWKRGIEANLNQSAMTVRAVLSTEKTPLSRIASFKVGQTIALDVAIRDLISIECEDQCLFRGQIGRSRDSYVVRIEEGVDPAKEFMNDILSD